MDNLQEHQQYISSELLLNIVQKEFEYESERNKGLQSRAGIFISFIGVIMTFFPSYIKIIDIINKPNETVGQTGFSLFYVFLVILLFIGLIISLILFVLILETKKYKILNSSGFDENNCIYARDKVSLELMKEYRIILEYNRDVNEKKAKLFQRACIVLVICIMLMPIIISIGAFV